MSIRIFLAQRKRFASGVEVIPGATVTYSVLEFSPRHRASRRKRHGNFYRDDFFALFVIIATSPLAPD